MARIGIVSDLVLRNPYSGMAIYISEITRQLAASSTHTFIPIYLQPPAPPFEPIWVQIKSRLSIFKNKLDIIYFPNPPTSIFTSIPSVLTIPDLSFIYDASFSFLVKAYLWLTYLISAHSANAITTFSQNSLRDISKYLFVNPKKVTIIAPFANEKFNHLLLPTEQIILSVPGTFVPRKNISELLVAYNNLPESLQKKYRLVIVGKKDQKYFPKLNQDKNIDFVGNVSTSEILELYQKSAILVCTSLYEGFGLPCLEAMSAGVPVIAYNNSSLTEIVGKAGMLVRNSKELCYALEKLLHKKSLRDYYRSQGYKQAKKFSRSVSTSKLLKVFNYASLHR